MWEPGIPATRCWFQQPRIITLIARHAEKEDTYGHGETRARLQETSIGSFRKMVVDLERPQIPHSLPLASFRKMVVGLDRPRIPHRLKLASFGAFSRRPGYLAPTHCLLPTPNLTIAPDWTALATDAPRDSRSLDRKPGLTAAGYKISW
jgi:hypothetical protein